MNLTINKIFLKKAVICLAVFSVFSASLDAFSQNDTVYNENVTVNVGFNPIVTDANKITENPSIFDTSFSQINLLFDKIDKGYDTHIGFDTIKPAQVKGEPVAKLYNFNLKGGLGMALSKKIGNGFAPLIQASYSSLRDRSLLYGADVYSRSVIGQTKDYGYAGYSDNSINLWGKKIFNNYSFSSRAYYNYNRHYLYGDTLYPSSDIAKKDYRAAYHNVGLDLAYAKLKRNTSFNHNALFSINYTTSKLKSKELDLHLLLDGSKTVHFFGNTEQTLGLSFDYRHAFRKYKGNWGQYPPLNSEINRGEDYVLAQYWNDMDKYSQQRAVFNFSPYFIFDYKKFHFFASLAFIPKINGYNSFQTLPTATVSFEFIQNILSVYAGVKSEEKLPGLYEKIKQNPFLAASIRLQDEANTNLFAKIIANFSPYGQLSVEGGVTDMRNAGFFYNLSVYQHNVFNTMNIEYANAKRYYAKAETHFTFSDTFKLGLNATFQNVKRNDDQTAWYCPKFYTSLKAEYKYNDKLFITLNPSFKTKQKARYITAEYELKPMVDVNLEATYQYSDNWSFFIDLENLAFQKYQRYYEYPVYSFIGLIGANYRF